MVLQEETLDLEAEKQVEKTLFHSLHEAFVGRRKKSPRTLPKSTPTPCPEALGSTPRRPWKSVTQKSHFCRLIPCRGSAVCLPWARKMRPRLYINILEPLMHESSPSCTLRETEPPEGTWQTNSSEEIRLPVYHVNRDVDRGGKTNYDYKP